MVARAPGLRIALRIEAAGAVEHEARSGGKRIEDGRGGGEKGYSHF